VHEDTGEVRVPRLVGVFGAGRIINPKSARSQVIGGMTQGLSLALHEHSVIGPRFGHVVNHDLADYHIAPNADTGSIEAYFLDGEDPHTNPMGPENRRGLLRRHRRSHRQRGVPRHRHPRARARPADHSRQAAGRRAGRTNFLCYPRLDSTRLDASAKYISTP
jgi:hypothetical protein